MHIKSLQKNFFSLCDISLQSLCTERDQNLSIYDPSIFMDSGEATDFLCTLVFQEQLVIPCVKSM